MMLPNSFSLRLMLLLFVPVSITAQNGPSEPATAIPVTQVTSQDTTLHLRDNSQPWTLQECIAYAQLNNISVQQQQLNVKMSQADLLSSKGNMLPNLNAGASHTYQYGRTVDRYTNTFANSQVLSENFYITSSLTLFSGMQNYNTLKQSQYSLEASRFQVLQTQYDIGMNVASAYLNVLYTQDQLTLATEQAKLTQGQVDRMQQLVTAGAQAKGTLLELQSQLATEQVNVVSAQSAVTISYLNLTQLMNLDSTAGFTIVRPGLETPNEAILSSTPDQIYQTAVAMQPGIKKAQLDYMSADKGVSIAQGAYSPSVTLQGSLGTGYSGLAKNVSSSTLTGVDTIGLTTGGDYVLIPQYSTTFVTTPFADQFQNNVNKSIGVQINIPIFNRFQVNSSVARAKIQRESAQLNVDLSEQQLRKNIAQAHADAQAAFLKYQASQKAVDASKEAFKYTEEKFNLGASNSIDYNNAKNNLARAESNLVQSKYDYIFRVKVLDYYQGKPLTF
jgi:outer membrane protein